MTFDELKKQAEERISEIKADYKRHCTEKLTTYNINTAMELCNDFIIFEFGWAWEVSQHCISLLNKIEVDSLEYTELSEIQMLLVEQAHQMDWIMEWYNDQEYAPHISSEEDINGWLLGCLEEYQNTEAD